MTQAALEQELLAFPGRTDGLRHILRYTLYPVTYYRSNVWQHSRRVGWLVQELIPLARAAFGERLDHDKILALALVHDDAEMITGDIQLGLKTKMTAAQRTAIDQDEERAIEVLAKRFPPMLGRYRYHELLRSVLFLDCLEARVMKYADKFDAFGEALHEIFAGNRLFTQRVQDAALGEIPIPPENYLPYLTEFSATFPYTAPLLTISHNLLAPPTWIDFAAVSGLGTPHTQKSFWEPTDYQPYDAWKEVIQKYAAPDELVLYWTQREFTQ